MTRPEPISVRSKTGGRCGEYRVFRPAPFAHRGRYTSWFTTPLARLAWPGSAESLPANSPEPPARTRPRARGARRGLFQRRKFRLYPEEAREAVRRGGGNQGGTVDAASKQNMMIGRQTSARRSAAATSRPLLFALAALGHVRAQQCPPPPATSTSTSLNKIKNNILKNGLNKASCQDLMCLPLPRLARSRKEITTVKKIITTLPLYPKRERLRFSSRSVRHPQPRAEGWRAEAALRR